LVNSNYFTTMPGFSWFYGLQAVYGDDSQEEASQQLVEVVRGDLIVSVGGSGSIAVSDEARLVFGCNKIKIGVA